MSWTDKIAIENILKLRDEFDIKFAVETGTFRGINAELYAHHFTVVFTAEIDEIYYRTAKAKLSKFRNVYVFNLPSSTLLSYFKRDRDDILFIYLDAHFYNPKARPEDKWAVIKELKALKDFKKCVICIHDFDNGELGHLCYDGENMGWNVIGKHIKKVNPDFYYYTNTRKWCDIYNQGNIWELPIKVDELVLDNLRYANRSDEKRYRGILYAVPRKLNLKKYKLVEYEPRA